jgi:hypothetical protein
MRLWPRKRPWYYEDKFGSIRNQEIDQDGMKFIVTRGVTPSMAALEQSLNKVKGLYQDKFGSIMDQESCGSMRRG